MIGQDGSHASALYSLFQPGTLLPYPLNGLIQLPKLPKSLLLSYRLTWIGYGKFWLRFGWYGLYGLVRPCTALYGQPYHTLPNFPKYFISSSLQLLISSYPYTQLISTLPLKLSFVKV